MALIPYLPLPSLYLVYFYARNAQCISKGVPGFSGLKKRTWRFQGIRAWREGMLFSEASTLNLI